MPAIRRLLALAFLPFLAASEPWPALAEPVEVSPNACSPERSWDIWPSPLENENLDQEQCVCNYADIDPERQALGTGQTFRPTKPWLERVDFAMFNNSDPRPVRIRITPWRDDLSTTLADPPLWTDTISLAGEWFRRQSKSVFPRIAVEPDAEYLVYFESEGILNPDQLHWGWKICRTPPGSADAYDRGRLFVAGTELPNRDLWFRTYSPGTSGPTLPPYEFSSERGWIPPVAEPQAVTLALLREALEQLQPSIPCQPGCSPQPCRPTCSQLAYVHAGLYRIAMRQGDSSAPQFASTAAGILDVAAADPLEIDSSIGWPLRPGISYDLIRHEPALSSDFHERMRVWFRREAERRWNQIGEAGVTNRTLINALVIEMLFTFFPQEESTRPDWLAYADKVWEEFFSVVDVQEDSMPYEALDVELALLLAQFRSRREPFPTEELRGLLERYALRATPDGPSLPVGDAHGWAESNATQLWIFEKAATLYPEDASWYRWKALRSLASIYSRYPVSTTHHPVHGFYAGELLSLALAGVDLDESITPNPRTRQEGPTTARNEVDNASFALSRLSPLGQTFVSPTSPLVRINFRIASKKDLIPRLRISLWEWAGSVPATRPRPTLFSGFASSELSADGSVLLSAFPFLDIPPGTMLYAELSTPTSAVRVDGSRGTDSYPFGGAYGAGTSRADDLWFEVFTLPDTGGSSLTTRRAIRMVSEFDPDPHFRFFQFQGDPVPDKLILSSGDDPNGFHLGVNLAMAPSGHGHSETGAIASIMAGGSVIFADGAIENSFGKVNPDHAQSAPIVRRYTRGTFLGAPDGTAVEHFADYRRATVAHVAWNESLGWNIRQERRFIFVRDRFVLVRDRFQAFGTGNWAEFACGTLWHANALRFAHGQNWFEMFYRQPKGVAPTLFRNPEHYGFVWMSDRNQDMGAYREARFDALVDTPTAPYIIYQKWPASSDPFAKWLDTIIIPHDAFVSPQSLAAETRMLLADEDAFAVQTTVQSELWTVVDNPQRRRLTVGTPGESDYVDTDALYVLHRAEGFNPSYLLVREGTVANIGGESWTAPHVTTVEIGGN